MLASATLGMLLGLPALPGGQPGPLPGPRQVRAAPFPGLDWAVLDDRLATYGIARSTAIRLGLQGRVLWVDATANMDAVNTKEKIDALVAKAASVGFNSIVYDVKPISGYTMYPSALTKQITQWRAGRFEPGYDPVKHFVAAAKREGIGLYAALNAFSEGHRVVLDRPGEIRPKPETPGWGYDNPELQTVQYVPQPVLVLPRGGTFPISSQVNPPKVEGLAVFLPEAKLSAAEWHAAIDSLGVVVAAGREPLEAPAGGSILAAAGAGVEALKQAAAVGMKPLFGAKAAFLPISKNQTQLPLMMNPHDERNQERALSFIREVLQRYAVDGVIYDDRLRFGGLNADFSPLSKAKFEKVVGRRLNWPDDVYRFTVNHRLNRDAQGRPFVSIRPGPYYDAWLAWRAAEMAGFIGKVRRTVDQIRPGSKLGVYAGSWYGDYAQYGNNYGSYQLSAGLPFLTPAYRRTGFAAQLDFLITGAYYSVPTMQEAVERGLPPGRTVEAAGIVTNRAARDQTWSYAGIMLADYWREPKMVEQALQAAAYTTQGVMVFDLSHQIDRFWPVFERAFKTKRRAPHHLPGLLPKVRAQRAAWDKSGVKDSAFPMLEGAPGAGF